MFNKIAFVDNEGLCRWPLPKCNQNKEDLAKLDIMEESRRSLWESVEESISVIGLAIGFVIGFGGIIFLIFGWARIKNMVLSSQVQC